MEDVTNCAHQHRSRAREMKLSCVAGMLYSLEYACAGGSSPWGFPADGSHSSVFYKLLTDFP